MLTQQDNDTLCRVGPGTLMGNLLRRYWLPALLSTEAPEPDGPPVRVRLLGEDLIAFRDTTGAVGLVANACPHRGASLFFGRNEEAGLRCVYHGWKFDTAGACVDMPSEPAESNFKNKVRVLAYPTHESGGIVWTYMGRQDKMQPFRDLGSDSIPQSEWRATKVYSPCNWIQGLEGNLDTTHISFLHGGRPPQLRDKGAPEGDETDRPGYPSAAMRGYIHRSVTGAYLEVEETWYGFRYAGIRPTEQGNVNVRVSDFILPLFTYVPQPYLPVGGDSCIMMVPIDDETYWRYGIEMKPAIRNVQMDSGLYEVPGFGPGTRNTGRGGVQERTQWASNDYGMDREAQRERSFTGIEGIAQQDMAVTESMGAIYNRTQEHLGTSDRAIISMRRMLIKAARDLANGIEPQATDPGLPYQTIRSAERNIARDADWRELGTEKDPMWQAIEPLVITAQAGEPETTAIAHDESYHCDTGRLEAFSDGVFAIAITLLILEIGVPHVGPGGDLAQALLDEWPSYFGFALSFVTIGIMWMNHHEMFRDIERVDHWLMVANMLLLLTVSFIPFPTAVLAESLQEPDHLRTAMLLYGGTFTLNAIFFNALWLHAVQNRDQLIDHHVSTARVSRRTRRYIVGPLAYGITLPIAFVTPWASLALYVGYAILYLLPSGD